LILVGCSERGIIQATKTVTFTSVPFTVTPSITSSITATQEQYSQALTPSPLPSVTPASPPTLPFNPGVQNCLEIEPQGSSPVVSSGSLLFYSYDTDRIMSLNSTSALPQVFPNPLPDYIQAYYYSWQQLLISPYSGLIAWVQDDDTLHVYNPEDQSEREFSFAPEWGNLQAWLPDNRLAFTGPYVDPDYEAIASGNFYIFSMETGTADYYSLEFSGHFTLPSYTMSGGGERTLRYDPWLKRSAYAWEDPDSHDEGFLIWDNDEQKVLWQRGGWGRDSEFSFPAWQQDGSHLALPMPVEGEGGLLDLFSISADGSEINRLTYFSDMLSTWYRFHLAFWSPDEKYIAMIFSPDFSIDSRLTQSLFILDTQSGVVTDYCLPRQVNAIAWSPDSTQVAVKYEEREGEYNVQKIILLDLSHPAAYYLGDGVIEGWDSFLVP
jgi:hypothetical protein